MKTTTFADFTLNGTRYYIEYGECRKQTKYCDQYCPYEEYCDAHREAKAQA